MNNIQKNFKAKRGLSMAAGGLLSPEYETEMKQRDATQQRNAGLMYNSQTQMVSDGESRMRDISGQSGLSARQRAGALMEVGGEMAKMGIKTDPLGGALATSGLSERQKLKFGNDQFSNGGTANNFNLQQAMKAPLEQAPVGGGSFSMNPSPTVSKGFAGMTAGEGAMLKSFDNRANGVAAGPTVSKGFAGMRQGERDMLDSFDKRMNSYAEGGIVRGKGGPTDDEVPMRVAGKDVNLSDSEAVLPAKTVQALGGPEAVEELIETTNGKPPVKGGLRAGGDYFTGAVGDTIDPRELRPEFRNAAVATPQPAAAYTPPNPNANPNVGAGRPSAEALKYAEGQAARAEAQGASAAGNVAKQASPMAGNAMKVVRGLGAAGMVAAPVMAAASDAPTLGGKLQDGFGGPPLNEDQRLLAPGAGGINLRSLFDPKAQAARAEAVDRINSGETRESQELRSQGKAQMVDGPGEGSFKLPISEADKRAGQSELRKAQESMSPEDLIARRIAQAGPNADPRQVAHLRDALTYQRMDTNGKTAVDMGAQVGSIEKKYGATVGRERNGQLVITGGLNENEKVSEADRMARVEAEQAAREKQSAMWARKSAEVDARSDHPQIQQRGLRQLALIKDQDKSSADAAAAAAKANHDNLQLQLTKRAQDITLRGQENMQGNTESAARSARDKDRRSRTKDLLDMHATRADKEGKPVMDPALRADLERAYLGAVGGKMMDLPDEGPEGYEALSVQALNQAKLSAYVRSAMRKDKAGWNLNNIGKDANTTLNAAEMTYDAKTGMLDVGGYKVKGKDVWGDDMDLKALVETRKKKAN